METAGKLELLSTSHKIARHYGRALYLHPSIQSHIENVTWAETYEKAQELAAAGWAHRSEMPVIETADMEEFKEFIRSSRGSVVDKCPVTFDKKTTMPAKFFRPTQCQIYVDKVFLWLQHKDINRVVSGLHAAPIVASKDYRIIDGHHRWLSSMLSGVSLSAELVEEPMCDVLELAQKFTDSRNIMRNA